MFKIGSKVSPKIDCPNYVCILYGCDKVYKKNIYTVSGVNKDDAGDLCIKIEGINSGIKAPDGWKARDWDLLEQYPDATAEIASKFKEIGERIDIEIYEPVLN